MATKANWGVGVGVIVAVGVLVGVSVTVGVCVIVGVLVMVAVGGGVAVAVGVGGGVGRIAITDAPRPIALRMTTKPMRAMAATRE